MISICLPSMGRPERFHRMRDSARLTARGDVEFCVVLDPHDPHLDEYEAGEDTRFIVWRGVHSDLWNRAAMIARGWILMMAADDLVFQTPGWDDHVKTAFRGVPDGVLVAWADDATEHSYLATHPFVSQQWVIASGAFTPPYFEAWNADSWLLSVGIKLHRYQMLTHVRIEHMHVDYGTAPDDATYQKRRPLRPAANFHDRADWVMYEAEREYQAARLRRVMDHTVERYDPGLLDRYIECGLVAERP